MCVPDVLPVTCRGAPPNARRVVVAEHGDGEEASGEDQRGRQEERGAQARVKGAVGGVNDVQDELALAAAPTPLAFRLDGTVPVSTASTTIAWKLAGMPSRRRLAMRWEFSSELTSMPSTATPMTAPAPGLYPR